MTTIEEVSRTQLAVVQKMAYRIWPTAFKDILTAAQISYMLDWMYSISALEKQYDAGHRFIMAYAESQCAGYAAYEITPLAKEAKLHKIYLLSSIQGRGIGRLLIEEVISRARQSGAEVLRLNVNRYNKAVTFYEKLGFRIIEEQDNDIGNGFFMNDYVMAMAIT